MPELMKLLNSQDWLEIESGILILGAIAEGCTNYGSPEFGNHLPELIEQMIKFGLTHEKALIRSITCWTLSRYSTWIVHTTISSYGYRSVDEARNQFLQPLVFTLLDRILDNSKRVQEAACSAFATLEEEATSEIEIYLDKIVNTLIKALKQYQAKNLLILYDAIGTLADCISEPLANAENIAELLDELMQKWNNMPSDPNDPRSTDIFQLLECLSAISTAIGRKFMNFSETVFIKSVNMISDCINYNKTYENQQAEIEKCNQNNIELPSNITILDSPNKDYMVVGLDLLSGVTEGLSSEVARFIVQSQNSGLNVIDLMLECTKDPQAEVRQSAFAFIV